MYFAVMTTADTVARKYLLEAAAGGDRHFPAGHRRRMMCSMRGKTGRKKCIYFEGPFHGFVSSNQKSSSIE